MKKILILSTVTAISLFATNGANLIGLGAESRALGGTGIANFNGAENALSNPALLGKTKSEKEFSFGGTIFKSTVKVTTTKGNTSNPGIGTSKTSDQGTSMIPVISLLNRINDNVVFGLGMYGTAGMGTDFRGDDVTAHQGKVSLYNMRSTLMLMQFAPSLSYHQDNYGIGASIIMQYGELSIDYDAPKDTDADGTADTTVHVGNGPSQDFGYGYQIGGFYNINNDLTFAGVYKSAIDMEYKDQISNAAAAFGYGTPGGLAAKSDHLEQPAEIGIGLSFNSTSMTYTVDYKTIKWGEAKGYEDFGWQNQNVLALGAKYTSTNYWIGLGFNKANSPLSNNTSKKAVHHAGDSLSVQDNTDGDTMNLFNYAMFPATITKAYTFGAGYNVNKDSTISFAYMYAPEVSDTVSGTTVGVGDITTTHKQNVTTIAYKFNF